MKSQNDLIISIVAGVFAIGISLALFFTKREPVTPAASPKVNVAAVKLPEATVSYKNGLGGGGAAGGGFGGFGGGRGPGVPGGPGAFGPGGPQAGRGGGFNAAGSAGNASAGSGAGSPLKGRPFAGP